MPEPEKNKIIVSVIVPCRNEERFIGRCLDSIVAQDFPKDKMEIIVVDGYSEDGTKKIIEQYIKSYPLIKLLDNPKKITPAALNIGISQAQGEIIMKMDAHSTYQKDFISKCVKYLKDYNADNVGGAVIATPQENTFIAQAISFSLSHPFGVGDSYFRLGSIKPRQVDTVAFGCFKKEVFKKIGLFNENLARIEDIEFNSRLRKAGGKILLMPDIVAYYYPKSTLSGFFKHNFEDGIWVTYSLKFSRFAFSIFSWRHLAPFFFVLGLLGSFVLSFFLFQAKILFILIWGSYLLLNLFFSLKISLKKGLKYLSVLPVAFVVRHVGYGLGSIWGLVKIWV